MTDIFAALWLADSVGSFLTFGGDVYYHSPIQPEPLRSGCRGWSSFGSFVADQNLKVHGHTSQYYASRLINLEWVKHSAGEHTLYEGSADLTDKAGHALMTVYPVLRPDGDWSLIVINKDQTNAHSVRIAFDSGTGTASNFSGAVTVITFGSEQYVWHSDGANSHADPENAPISTVVSGGLNATYSLPRASVTVLRGKVANAHAEK